MQKMENIFCIYLYARCKEINSILHHLFYSVTDVSIIMGLKQNRRGLPGAVGDLDADAVAVLASALGSRVIAGSRPTQAGARAAPTIAVGAHGPAGPGSKAPVHGHVSYLRGREAEGISG